MKKFEQNQLDKAAKILREGGLIAFPTETVFGLGVIFDNEQSYKRLIEVKRTLQPSFAPANAASTPACPAPTTITSYLNIVLLPCLKFLSCLIHQYIFYLCFQQL